MVSGGIDAARQSRSNDVAGPAEPGRKLARELLARGRALARTDDADDRPAEQLCVAFDVKEGRRGVQHRQRLGVVGLDRKQRRGAGPPRALELRFRLCCRTEADRSSADIVPNVIWYRSDNPQKLPE